MKKVISLLLVLCMVFGMLSGMVLAANETYALVLAVGKESQFSNTVSAQLLFQDGTVKVVKLSQVHDCTDSTIDTEVPAPNTIVTYSVGADNAYTLMALETGVVTNQFWTDGWYMETGVGNGIANIDNGRYANNKTVFVVGVKDVTNTTTFSTYTGISNVPSFTANNGSIYYAMNAKGNAVGAVFCVDANVLPLTLEQPMMLHKTGIEPLTAASPTNSYYTVAAVVDGAVTSVKVASYAYDSLCNGINLFSAVQTDANGNYSAFGTAGLNVSSHVAFGAYVDGVISLDGTPVVVEPTLPAYVWDMTAQKLVATTVDSLYQMEGTFYVTRAATLAAPINAIYAVSRNVKMPGEETGPTMVPLSVEQTVGGTVTLTQTEGLFGTRVAYKVTADEGYTFRWLEVNGRQFVERDFLVWTRDPITVKGVFRKKISANEPSYYYATDAFGRTIGMDPTLSYDTAVSLHQVYTDLGKVAAADLSAPATYYVDGVANFTKATLVNSILKSGSVDSFIGGQGVRTEVYYDAVAKTVNIVEINTYAGMIASHTDAVLDANGDIVTEAYVTLKMADGSALRGSYSGAVLSNGAMGPAASVVTNEFSKADIGKTIVYYTVGQADVNGDGVADGAQIQSVARATEVTGTVKGLVAFAGATTDITLDTTAYKTNATFDTLLSANLIDTVVKAYLDGNGNVLFLTGVASEDYALVLGVGKENMFANTVSAQLLFQDGTVKIVTLSNMHDVTDGTLDTEAPAANTVVTYVVGADGTYTLWTAANQGTVTNWVDTDGNGSGDTYGVTTGAATLDGWYYANANTTFTIGVRDSMGNTVYSTYTGISNVPTFTGSYDYYAGNIPIYYAMNLQGSAVAAVFCTDAQILGNATEQRMMLYKTGMENLTAVSPTNSYYTVAAVVDGAVTSVKVAPSAYYYYINTGMNLFSIAATDINGNYASFGFSGLNVSSYNDFGAYEDGIIILDGCATVVKDTLPAYVWSLEDQKLIATTVDALYDVVGTFHITRANTLAAPIDAIYAVVGTTPVAAPVMVSLTAEQTVGGTIALSQTEAAVGEWVSVKVTPDAGYEFSHLVVNGTAVEGLTFVVPETEIITVSAVFKKIKYAVTVTATANGTTAADKTEAAAGETVVITVTPATGYELGTLKVLTASGMEVELSDNAFVMPAEAVTVTATFEKISEPTAYAITVAAATNGTVAVDKAKAVAGEVVSVIVEPNAGYVLNTLSVTTASGTKVPATGLSFVMPAEAVTVAATFKQSNGPVITVESTVGYVGKTVSVPIKIEKNTGIAGLHLEMNYPEGITLQSITVGDALKNLAFTEPGNLSQKTLVLPWDGQDADNSNGTILTLQFLVAENTAEGTYPVTLTCIDAYDNATEKVDLLIVNGTVTVKKYMPGDINGDGVITTKDVTILRRYIAGGYSINYVEAALDVNGDGVITTKDVTILRRYIAGGYGVVLR